MDGPPQSLEPHVGQESDLILPYSVLLNIIVYFQLDLRHRNDWLHVAIQTHQDVDQVVSTWWSFGRLLSFYSPIVRHMNEILTMTYISVVFHKLLDKRIILFTNLITQSQQPRDIYRNTSCRSEFQRW